MRTLAFVTLAAALSGCAAQEQPTIIDEMRTKGDFHGLYEVREEARRFVKQENLRSKTTWQAIEPDARTMVPRCLVPLVASWDAASKNSPQPIVMVSCSKVDGKFGTGRTWDVPVPVYVPPLSK